MTGLIQIEVAQTGTSQFVLIGLDKSGNEYMGTLFGGSEVQWQLLKERPLRVPDQSR